jgi:hypothetical protein
VTGPLQSAAPGFRWVYYGVVTALVSAVAVRVVAFVSGGGDVVSRLYIGAAVGVTVGSAISLAGMLRFRTLPAGLAAARLLVLVAAVAQAIGLVAAAGYAASRLGATVLPPVFPNWGYRAGLALTAAAAALFLAFTRAAAWHLGLPGRAAVALSAAGLAAGLMVCYALTVATRFGVVLPGTALTIVTLLLAVVLMVNLSDLLPGMAAAAAGPPVPPGVPPGAPPATGTPEEKPADAPAGKPWLRGGRGG